MVHDERNTLSEDSGHGSIYYPVGRIMRVFVWKLQYQYHDPLINIMGSSIISRQTRRKTES